MPSDQGSEMNPRGKADLLLPTLEQPTSGPSLGQPLPTYLNYPPAAFPGSLDLASTFPIMPGQMHPYFDYDSQPLWAGNGDPNLTSFLPMPYFGDQIAIPPADSVFGFHPAGAIVNPFAGYSSTQIPAAPFDAFGSNKVNVSSSSITTATSNSPTQRFVLTVPSSQGRTLLSLLQPPIFASLLLLLPVVPCIAAVVVWSPIHPVVFGWTGFFVVGSSHSQPFVPSGGFRPNPPS